MRLVFAGTPAAAVPSLAALADAGHDLALVVTRPDALQGRRRVLTPSAVAQAAEVRGIPVCKTARLDEPAAAAIGAVAPQLGVVVAYGALVREPLLSAPEHGWINLHFSRLPHWRGAAPVQHALIAGDEVTGASVFRLVAELDAGDLLGELDYRVPPAATAGDVLDALAHRGAHLLREVVGAIETGSAVARPQSGAPTFAPKLSLDDARVRWNEPATAVLARIRGVTPEPGAFTTIEGARLKILTAQQGGWDTELAPGVIAPHGRELLVGTATAPVGLVTVQPAGKPAMAAVDWWRGLRTDAMRADT